MKTLLYEIRYYLAVTVLVLLLVPDHEKASPIKDANETAKPISTIRKNKIKYPAYVRVAPNWELQIELQILIDEEMKKKILIKGPMTYIPD